MAAEIPVEVRTARFEVSRLVIQRAALLQQATRDGVVNHVRLSEIDREIGGLLDQTLPLIDPCDASESEPLVLLPVRLETRFSTSESATTLKVRIYPDEIHVDDLVRGLTADEITAGTGYWTSVWHDPVPDDAWTNLVGVVGAERAEWVAHACTPTNRDQRSSAAPEFPTPAPHGPRNVVARALPDRFVILAIQDGQVSRAVGRPVPVDLPLSPIPLEGDEPMRSADGLTVPPGAEWLVDYDAALEVGMAVNVTLVGGPVPIQRVIALGTRASLTPAEGASELEDLFTGHRFGAGFALLAQGTPTNNSERQRSPLRRRAEPEPPPRTPPEAQPESDTFAAAELLGIDSAVLTSLVGSGFNEQAVARLVNTALWTPGWGEYLRRLDDKGIPGVVDAQRESARRLFRDHVRGRGTAPAIRVGAQPYGVLSVSDLQVWKPQVEETTAGIAVVVRRLMVEWLKAAEENVPRVRPGQDDIHATVLDLLGSSPVMQGLRVRPVVSDDISDAIIAALGLDWREFEAERMSMVAVVANLVGVDASKIKPDSLGGSRPLPLPLASPRDPEFITALLGSPSNILAVDSVLQALLVLAWDSAELDVAKASPATVLPDLIGFVQLDSHLKVEVESLVTRADAAGSQELLDMVTKLQSAGVSLAGPSTLRRYQPVEFIRTSLAEVALSAPETDQARTVAASALAGWLFAMGYRSEVRAAMQELISTDIEVRRLAVGEALDCSSHRLDAWATAIAAERSALQAGRRTAQDPGGALGCTIGAYGVVENLYPQNENGLSLDGWIHTPSSQHAVAAGMLRSSHLSHLPASGSKEDGGPFAIDLSSVRVQAAAHVIDGVRQGQHIGALIGYQIERGLAEAGLARLQLSLRTIAPLVAHRLHEGDDSEPEAAMEAIAATNVVDGVLLLKSHTPGDQALRDRLNQVPANIYLEPGDWKNLDNNDWDTITRILQEAANTVDTVADIMLSESVMQFATGNSQRAAAAMDAMSTGASPSETIDILEAHDSAERLTHRVLAIVGGVLPTSSWNPARPRALVEPRLEAWAAAHLGDPSTVVLAEINGQRVTLDEAGFAALDLVYAADGIALDRAIRMAVPELKDAPLTESRDAAWAGELRPLIPLVALAASLRSTITGASPLLPGDLSRPGEKATRHLVDALDELTARVTTLAGSLSAAVVQLEGTVSSIPKDGIVAEATDANAIARAALTLHPFGIPLDPPADRPLDVAWVRDAWQVARARSLAAQAAADQLTAAVGNAGLSAEIALDLARDVVQTVFGDGFAVVPLLLPSAVGVDRFVGAVTEPAFSQPSASSLRRFVRDMGTVRPQVTRFSEALLLSGANGQRRTLEAVQLTGTDAGGFPAPGTEHWLAGPLPPDKPWPSSSAAHLVLDRVGTLDASAALAGLVIDAWVEDLPSQPGPEAGLADSGGRRAVSGVALRCNSASARPPQAILSAVSPDGLRWNTESLRGVIEHTMNLARCRMVTLERLNGAGLVLPALYTKHSSLQGERYLDFSKLASTASSFVAMPFVKEMGS